MARTFEQRLAPFVPWSTDVCWEDYGGTWVRMFEPHCYHFIRFLNWEETVGEREAKEVGFKYNVDLAEVDLRVLPYNNVRQALKSYGWTFWVDGLQSDHAGDLVCGWDDPEGMDRCIAAACFEHGCKAPLFDLNTNASVGGMLQARAESMSMSRDALLRTNLLEQPVNAIGTSAESYMCGHIFTRDVQDSLKPIELTKHEARWRATLNHVHKVKKS